MLCIENTALCAPKKNRFKPFKTKQLRAIEVNQELAKLEGLENWPRRKRIIRDAIERRRVNPDLLRSGDGLKPNTPLVECVVLHKTDQDLAYAEFLLKRGSDPSIAIKQRLDFGVKDPLLRYAKTAEMAELLIQYGAHKDAQVLGIWRNKFKKR